VTTGQLGGPATTTYIDAFLRLTVTPQITVENTIFLAVDVENTVPDNSVSVQGNPGLATQQATTQVLVTDGGTVMIGGVIQTTNSVSVRQVPFLGNVPILGNVFKNRAVQTQTQELIFFLTPKIIQT
jgi:type IV pilus assembly protein PilQ